MAIFHAATNTPSKRDLVEPWLIDQAWGPERGDVEVELVASFHLDDPDGEVGMQVFVARTEPDRWLVPLTYRAQPTADLEHALIGEMTHSVLGARFVYDGLADGRLLTVLAGVAVTGYGQALGFARVDGCWHSIPDEMMVRGRATVGAMAMVDDLVLHSPDSSEAPVFRNKALEMTVHRRLEDRPLPEIGLTATWPGQATPITLVEVVPLTSGRTGDAEGPPVR